MKKTALVLGLSAIAGAAVLGCATLPGDAELDQMAANMAKTAFRDQGIAKTDRVTGIDDTLKACSAADVAGKPLDAVRTKAIEEANLKTIQWPADGQFLGDWKEGEKIAQNGRGLTWTDDAKTPNGGNCYNCHQISKQEISFGTIGPSLYNYGKLRGVANPNDPASKPIVEYTWGKIWNAKAYSACSTMPRFGHAGVLTQDQIRDLMALLLDPKSPVNAD